MLGQLKKPRPGRVEPAGALRSHPRTWRRTWAAQIIEQVSRHRVNLCEVRRISVPIVNSAKCPIRSFRGVLCAEYFLIEATLNPIAGSSEGVQCRRFGRNERLAIGVFIAGAVIVAALVVVVATYWLRPL